MYALPNNTQRKLIVKVRGGITQKLDNFASQTSPANSGNSSQNVSTFKTLGSKHQIIDEAGFNAELSHLPQPIFHSIQEKSSSKSKASSHQQRSQHKQQYITPEHNEMIKFVQQTWKGVERDYKKSVNNFINNLDLNIDSPPLDHRHSSIAHQRAKQANAKKKSATKSTPLLLTGPYHHISSSLGDSMSATTKESFQPFDLETFWGDRILKRLTEEK